MESKTSSNAMVPTMTSGEATKFDKEIDASVTMTTMTNNTKNDSNTDAPEKTKSYHCEDQEKGQEINKNSVSLTMLKGVELVNSTRNLMNLTDIQPETTPKFEERVGYNINSKDFDTETRTIAKEWKLGRKLTKY